MKQLKPGNTQRCSYCREMASWRTSSMSLTKYSCTAHKEELAKHERKTADNGHMSEADHQTWGRH